LKETAVRISLIPFPTKSNPDSILFRQDHSSITSYAVYNSLGVIVKRVDLKGKTHGKVKTPHVLEYTRYLNNKEHGYSAKPDNDNVREARESEIP